MTASIRSLLVPIGLVVIAALLTVPWSYWVINAAYDRDIVDNAKTLARRVELRIMLAPRGLTHQEASGALETELATDPTVQLAVFYELGPQRVVRIAWRRAQQPDRQIWDYDEVNRRIASGMQVERGQESYRISVPWIHQGRPLGLTYLELSRAALNEDFWQKDGSLVTRVITLTAVAVAVLSTAGVLAYGYWRRAFIVQERAELARQGMLAERGLTAAVLAHEIRNPLAALRFQLHSLRRNAAQPQQVAGTADMIDSELSRIQQLVTDYLELEKARSMQVQQVDVEPAARSLQSLMGELFKQTETQLILAPPPPEPVVVMCDPHALRQVLINLVLNAQQAMGRGGTVTLRIGREEQFGVIDVSDTGPGIPPEMRDRLFKPFQTSRREGHGIGLALVKRFVDNFGGSVTVDSEVGRGTTFHLKLPLAGIDDGGGDGATSGTDLKPLQAT